MRDVTVRDGRSSGLGSFVGAILGGVAGSKIGSGHGSTAATVGGALAGGMAGQHVEQSRSGSSTTELSVRFDNGDVRTYQIEPGESFRIGDTVRVITSGGMTRITH
ncbi:MAG: glycine zipper 2TM domain-containing protein [Noviherbaspirillum sp.]